MPDDEPIEEDLPDDAPDDEVPAPGEPLREKRPSLVYGAIGAGAAALLILLLIVWISSRDDEGGNPTLCLDIPVSSASSEILRGNVEQIDVLIDSDQPLNGLTAIQLHMTDGDCRRLPEGADNRDALYQILGVVALYNEEGERRVDVNYLRQDVPFALLATSTSTPTETAIPTETAPPSATLEPSPTQTATATPTITQTSTATATPTATIPVAAGSPLATLTAEASPPGSPSPLASPLPTETPTATKTPAR